LIFRLTLLILIFWCHWDTPLLIIDITPLDIIDDIDYIITPLLLLIITPLRHITPFWHYIIDAFAIRYYIDSLLIIVYYWIFITPAIAISFHYAIYSFSLHFADIFAIIIDLLPLFTDFIIIDIIDIDITDAIIFRHFHYWLHYYYYSTLFIIIIDTWLLPLFIIDALRHIDIAIIIDYFILITPFYWLLTLLLHWWHYWYW
jgi:hypothetical protein